jgi:sulfate adenylyltransferase
MSVRARAALTLDARALADLRLLLDGAYAPLDGFLGSADYERVVEDVRLADGSLWPLPIVLAVEPGNTPPVDSEVDLLDESGIRRGTLTLREVYAYDKRREAERVYGTTDEKHPGVAAVYRQGDVLLAGPVTPGVPWDDDAPKPAETKAEFARRGWRTVVGFQTRNPIHRAHEYIQKVALEIVDGLFVHPLVGETKSDDIPADVRRRCYRALIDNYYPAGRVVLAEWPAAMRYAGPREALFHALVRKNYGCTHFIVGRDHAGVGSYYGTYDAQTFVGSFTGPELGIVPLMFENTFFCRACNGMASAKTCPHPETDRVSLSGTAVRAMLEAGEIPPVEFTRPEVARVLIEAYKR